MAGFKTATTVKLSVHPEKREVMVAHYISFLPIETNNPKGIKRHTIE